ADAAHADPLGVDVLASPQVIDGTPQVPAGVVVEGVLLRLARLDAPRPGDGLVVGGAALDARHAGAVIAGVDGHADQAAPRQLVQPAADALLAAAGAVQHRHPRPPLAL